MKKIIVILLLCGFALAQGSYVFSAYLEDRSASPFLQTYLDSVMIIRYEDNGITVIETLYTDELGFVSADSMFTGDNYERCYAVLDGYTFGDNGWTRFETKDFDSTSTTLTVALRGFTSPGDSTVVISFTLVDLDGSPLASQRVSHFAGVPFRGTENSISPSTGNVYRSKTYTANESGYIEITTLKHSSNYIKIGDYYLTNPFVATANMDLDNIVFTP